MCKSCTRSILQFCLRIINMVFFLSGMLLLAFGIAIVVSPEKVLTIVGDAGVDIRIIPSEVVYASGIFMIIVGGVVGIIALFGLCGTCYEDNKCMLTTYIIIMVALLMAEAALIIFAAVNPDKLQDYVQQRMNKSIITNFTQQDISIASNGSIVLPNNAIGAAWTATQFGVGCCGVYGPNDYSNLPASQRMENIGPGGIPVVLLVPISCCSLNSPGVPKAKSDFKSFDLCIASQLLTTNSPFINQINCYTAVYDIIKSYSKIAIGIAAGIYGLQLILLVMSIIIYCYK